MRLAHVSFNRFPLIYSHLKNVKYLRQQKFLNLEYCQCSFHVFISQLLADFPFEATIYVQYHQIMTLIVVLYAHFNASFAPPSSLSTTLRLCSIHQSQAFCRAPTLSGNNNENSGTSSSSFILSLLPLHFALTF